MAAFRAFLQGLKPGEIGFCIASFGGISATLLARKSLSDEAKQREFVERDGVAPTILSFHGTTADANIESILAQNFDLARLAANTGNRGYYGAGIYFSVRAHAPFAFSSKA